MSDKILQSIFEFTKKYKDPESNTPFDAKILKYKLLRKMVI